MNKQFIVLAFKDFLADFVKKDGCHDCFSIFVVYFFSLTFSTCIIGTVFNFSGEMNYYNMQLFSSQWIHPVKDAAACFANSMLEVLNIYL